MQSSSRPPLINVAETARAPVRPSPEPVSFAESFAEARIALDCARAASSHPDTLPLNRRRACFRIVSFASSVLPAEAAPARNQTLQTFHEPLKNLLSKVAVRTRDARASK